MAKYSYELICNMREAIFEGITFDYYFYNCMDSKLKKKIARKAWNRATTFVNNEEEWRKYILSEMKPIFNRFAELVDDYWNNGFGYFQLEEAFGITNSSIKEIIHKIEG